MYNTLNTVKWLSITDVSDDGVGIKGNTESLDELANTHSENYGVENINQRIKLYFGEQYGLVLKPVKKME